MKKSIFIQFYYLLHLFNQMQMLVGKDNVNLAGPINAGQSIWQMFSFNKLDGAIRGRIRR
ncbi:MAG: hypothetical protein IPO94_05145 [Saprospiraceae bacterium]|nr:hypothetical protein [Saprospiraceae bacterium]